MMYLIRGIGFLLALRSTISLGDKDATAESAASRAGIAASNSFSAIAFSDKIVSAVN